MLQTAPAPSLLKTLAPTVAPPAKSRSRKVNGFVKACFRLRRLEARLAAAETKLTPLRNETIMAKIEVTNRRAGLTGGQVAEAERIIGVRSEGACARMREGTV